ncbi:unnamed protein product [Chrysoparadoxa australica]
MDGRGMSRTEVKRRVSALSAAKSTDMIRAQVQELLVSQAPIGFRQYPTVIKAAGRARDWRGVLRLVKQMEAGGARPNPYAYTAALTALGGCGRWEEALRLLSSIKPDSACYKCCLLILQKAGQSRRAVELLADMKAKGLEIDAQCINVVMNVLTKNGHPEQALAIFDKATAELGSELDVGSYTSAILATGRMGEWEWSVRLLQEMRAKGLSPNVFSYGSALGACAKGGAKGAATAMVLLQQLKEDGVEPNVVIYTAAIDACSKGGLWERALELLGEMRDAGVAANNFTYTCAIDALSRAGEVDHALELLSNLQDPDDACFNAAINSCVPEGRWELALELLEGMKARGLVRSTVSYNGVLKAAAGAGAWQVCLKLLREMEDRSVKREQATFSIAISACGAGDQWGMATELLKEMQALGLTPSVACYSSAIDVCGRCGQWARAWELINEMKAKGLGPSLVNYNIVIAGCGKAKQWEKSLEMLTRIKEDDLVPDVVSWSSAIDALVKVDKLEMAMELLAEMQDEGVQPNLYAFTSLMDGYGRLGEWKRALELFKQLKESGLSPSFVTYSTLISCLDGAGEHAKANELYSAGISAGHFTHWKGAGLVDFHEFTRGMSRVAIRNIFGDMVAGLVQAYGSDLYRHDPSTDLIIITGVGKGSKGGKGLLGDVVVEYLAEQFAIAAVPVVGNAGRLVVESKQLISWLEHSEMAPVLQICQS